MKKKFIAVVFLFVQIIMYGQIDVEVEITRDVPRPDAVDLGGDSSVLWGTFNLGASRPEEVGIYAGWADPTGELEYQAFDESQDNYLPPEACCALYGGETPPYDIQGTGMDIARSWLGKEWMLPDISDWAWLFEECSWKIETMDGRLGYRVTGPNGNSIFLPSWGDKIDKNEEGRPILYGAYWSETAAFGYIFGFDEEEEIAQIKKLALYFNLTSVPDSEWCVNSAARWDQLMIRPVKSKNPKNK